MFATLMFVAAAGIGPNHYPSQCEAVSGITCYVRLGQHWSGYPVKAKPVKVHHHGRPAHHHRKPVIHKSAHHKRKR